MNQLGIDSYTWLVIILTFGILGMFLEKFKEYACRKKMCRKRDSFSRDFVISDLLHSQH